MIGIAAPVRPRDDVVIDLTTEQQRVIRDAAGVSKPRVVVPRMRLVAYALAAKAQGFDTLPIARSEVTRERMLRPPPLANDGADTLIITIPLTRDQQELIRQTTGTSMSEMKLTWEEFRVAYHEEWYADHPPIRVGRSLVIISAASSYSAHIDERVVRLPAGGAAAAGGVFGTGMHDATQLALQLLEECISEEASVLDVGTGSGILAVAAVRLGARHVLATDIEESAVAAARETAAANDVNERMEVRRGSVDVANAPFDLVLANIYANVLVPLAPQLTAVVGAGGSLILSGITSPLAASVREAYAGQGLELMRELEQEHWTAFLFRRPAGPPDTVRP